jgi:hypothetical protein
MDIYFVDKNTLDNGIHEVHRSTCVYIPRPQHRLYLGYFKNGQDSLKKAKLIYSTTAKACHYCCPECDTK